jgi:hypothetical protein
VKADRLSCRCKLEGNKGEEPVVCLECCIFCPVSPAVDINRKYYTEKVLERSKVQQCKHKLHQDVRIKPGSRFIKKN